MDVNTYLVVGGGGGVNEWRVMQEAFMEQAWKWHRTHAHDPIRQLGSRQMWSSYVPVKKGNRSFEQVASLAHRCLINHLLAVKILVWLINNQCHLTPVPQWLQEFQHVKSPILF